MKDLSSDGRPRKTVKLSLGELARSTFSGPRSSLTRKGAGRQSITSKKDWGTPAKYVCAVKKMFGGAIDLDPCSNEFSIVEAKVEYMLPKQDGLKKEWDHKTIFVNPPYGNDKVNGKTIRDWLQKCAEAYELHGSEVLALVPVAPNTSHWKRFVFPKARAICFLYDTRLRFLENGIDGGKGAPMACAMVYWGKYFQKFFKVFLEHGAVIEVTPLHGKCIGNYPTSVNSNSSGPT